MVLQERTRVPRAWVARRHSAEESGFACLVRMGGVSVSVGGQNWKMGEMESDPISHFTHSTHFPIPYSSNIVKRGQTTIYLR